MMKLKQSYAFDHNKTIWKINVFEFIFSKPIIDIAPI